MFPSLIVRLAAPIGEWWLPVLGVLLTGCGVGLLSASAEELVAPTHSADSTVRSTVAVETIASCVTPPAPAVIEHVRLSLIRALRQVLAGDREQPR